MIEVLGDSVSTKEAMFDYNSGRDLWTIVGSSGVILTSPGI